MLTQANPVMTALSQMIGMAKASKDPMGTINNMANSNPQLQQVMQYIQQNGGNAKQAFYNLAQQKGVDPNTVLQQLNSIR
jgi:hypothetical protein